MENEQDLIKELISKIHIVQILKNTNYIIELRIHNISQDEKKNEITEWYTDSNTVQCRHAALERSLSFIRKIMAETNIEKVVFKNTYFSLFSI